MFRERYKIRGGIEGTNSGLKRATGLGQLRVRGRPAVFHAIYLKVAGWNMRRAMVCAALRKIVYERASRAVLCRIFTLFRPLLTTRRIYRWHKTQNRTDLRQVGAFPPLCTAA